MGSDGGKVKIGAADARHFGIGSRCENAGGIRCTRRGLSSGRMT